MTQAQVIAISVTSRKKNQLKRKTKTRHSPSRFEDNYHGDGCSADVRKREKTGTCKATSLQLELRLLSQENKSHYSNPKRTNEYCLTQETRSATEQARKLPDLIGVTLPTSFRVRVRSKFVLVPLS
jgi:hypothetical protein